MQKKRPDFIKAQARGRFIKSGLFSFKELSRHNGIINLLEKESGLVWSLIADERNMTGFSLLVPDLFQHDHFISGIESDNEGLTIGQKILEFKQSPIWKGDIPTLTENPVQRERELKLLINSMDSEDSFLSILEDRDSTIFQKKAREITDKALSRNQTLLSELNDLIGLGQGLTPSGDDFITGLLLAEHCLPITRKIDKTAIENRLKSTTPPGRTMVSSALRNSFPAFIINYLKQIEKAESETDIRSAIKAASAHGATSGRDCLAGFYWSAKHLITRPNPK